MSVSMLTQSRKYTQFFNLRGSVCSFCCYTSRVTQKSHKREKKWTNFLIFQRIFTAQSNPKQKLKQHSGYVLYNKFSYFSALIL